MSRAIGNLLARMFTFLVPTKIIFGLNSVSKIREELDRIGARKVFIVTDAVVEKAGLVDEVKAELPSGLDIDTYNRVEPEPRLEIAEDLATAVRSIRPDLILGIGGGSVLDLAKIAAVMITNEGSVSDYCKSILNIETFRSKGQSTILIPTTAGTGSEVSNTSMLVVGGMKIFLRSRFLFPELAIVDPKMSLTMPQKVTAATGLDALSHAIEGLMSSNSSALTDALALKSVELISQNLIKAYRDGRDIDARTAMSLAAMMAGMVLNAGMVYGHSVAYTIATRYKLAHGVSCAIPLSYVMAYNLSTCVDKLQKVAIAMGENVSGLNPEEAARKSVEAVQRFVHELGVPTNLTSIGVPREILPVLASECLEKYHRPNNPRVMSIDDAVALYNRIWEGRPFG